MSVKGEYPLAPGLLHRLLASRRMTRVEFEQKINLSHGVLSKAFGGGNIRYEITETIADFFQVKARALRMGIIFSQDLDLTVMRAYRMVALHCRPGGDFAEISIEEDMVAHIKKWSRRDFRDLNLKEPEFRRLIFALDGRCFIRRSDGRYMRLTGSESGLCASIIGAVTETVMQSANYDIGPSVAKLISADFASDEEITPQQHYEIQRDVVSAITVEYPHTNCWIIECWGQLHAAFENTSDEKWESAIEPVWKQLKQLRGALAKRCRLRTETHEAKAFALQQYIRELRSFVEAFSPT